MGKTGTTGKTGQPAWAKRILKLLEQAKAKDPDLVRFGAYSHKYKLSPPASEETIQKFEEQEGIRLPEEYRDFLLFVGNGGAGPYYEDTEKVVKYKSSPQYIFRFYNSHHNILC